MGYDAAWAVFALSNVGQTTSTTDIKTCTDNKVLVTQFVDYDDKPSPVSSLSSAFVIDGRTVAFEGSGSVSGLAATQTLACGSCPDIAPGIGACGELASRIYHYLDKPSTPNQLGAGLCRSL